MIEKKEEELKNLKERITESEANYDKLQKKYIKLKQNFKVRFDQTSLVILSTSLSFIIKNTSPLQMISH